jgi:hypothetical protein
MAQATASLTPGGDQQAATELEGDHGRHQHAGDAEFLHVGSCPAVGTYDAPTLMNLDQGQQQSAGEQASRAKRALRRLVPGHQFVFGAAEASAFSRSSRSSQLCGHNFTRTASCSRAFGRSPVST